MVYHLSMEVMVEIQEARVGSVVVAGLGTGTNLLAAVPAVEVIQVVVLVPHFREVVIVAVVVVRMPYQQ